MKFTFHLYPIYSIPANVFFFARKSCICSANVRKCPAANIFVYPPPAFLGDIETRAVPSRVKLQHGGKQNRKW